MNISLLYYAEIIAKFSTKSKMNVLKLNGAADLACDSLKVCNFSIQCSIPSNAFATRGNILHVKNPEELNIRQKRWKNDCEFRGRPFQINRQRRVNSVLTLRYQLIQYTSYYEILTDVKQRRKSLNIQRHCRNLRYLTWDAGNIFLVDERKIK